MDCKTYEEHGVHIVEDLVPEGYVIIDEYTPCHTVTPWDYYGMCHQREYSRVLNAAGIKCELLQTRKRLLHPVGTGPRGSVRMGDNMYPYDYRIAVLAADENAAYVAIAAHKAEIDKWLNDPSLPMPEACRG